MQKIISLFKRDYEGTRQVYDEIVPGAEWVIDGEGVATVKVDGTACMVRDGALYKRFDRKLNKSAWRKKKRGHPGPWVLADYKPSPEGWEPCEPEPDSHTGHWPGWVPVGDGPDDKYYHEGFETWLRESGGFLPADGTYELLGPKIQKNPYNYAVHVLRCHGSEVIDAPRTFAELGGWFREHPIEGIVWHHPDGRMVKIKRKDFGLPWPPEPEKGGNE